MSIRQTLNERPAIGIGAAIGLVVIALVIIIWQVAGRRTDAGPDITDQAFYSDDDGQTYFTDSKAKLPPFTHNNKQAYLAGVFRCGDKGKPFIAYLSKYPDDVRKQLEADLKGGATPMMTARKGSSALLVKKPGPGKWVNRSDSEAYQQVTNVTCPNNDSVEIVRPGEKE